MDYQQHQIKTNWRWWLLGLLSLTVALCTLDIIFFFRFTRTCYAPLFHWGGHYAWLFVAIILAQIIAGLLICRRLNTDKINIPHRSTRACIVLTIGYVLQIPCVFIAMHLEGFPSLGALLTETNPQAIYGIQTTALICFIAYLFLFPRGFIGLIPVYQRFLHTYFPQRERQRATFVLAGAGAVIGALIGLILPPLAIEPAHGWQMAVIIIALLWPLWLLVWRIIYCSPEDARHMNEAELEYIHENN